MKKAFELSSMQAQTCLKNLQTIHSVLAAHDIQFVTIHFKGCEYDGYVDAIDYEPSTSIMDIIDYSLLSLWPHEYDWVEILSVKKKNIESALEALTYDYLNCTNVDWCIENVTNGRLVMDVVNKRTLLNIHQNPLSPSLIHQSVLDIALY